jgi:hypothetical protein
MNTLGCFSRTGLALVVSVAVVGCGGEVERGDGSASATAGVGVGGAGGVPGKGTGAGGGAPSAGTGGAGGSGGKDATGGKGGDSAPGGTGGVAAGGKDGPSGGGSGGAAGAAAGSGGATAGAGGTGGSMPAGSAYDGKGFVVHEWGTNTIVVGSDGSMQRGLHHEEEDLPPFVYDRLSAAAMPGSTSVLQVDVKMETPVTYFYSSAPLQVTASVDFPHGVFTQWYPAVSSFYPPVFSRDNFDGTPVMLQDPALDPTVHFQQPECKAKYTAVGSGVLDWGTFTVLGPDASPAVPEAPIDQYTWGHARQVKSNSLLVPVPGSPEGPQLEKFLFYRGLGNFALPATVTASGGSVAVTEADPARPVGAVFIVRVGEQGGAFHVFPEGIKGASLQDLAPTLDEAAPLDAYAADLGKAVEAALDGTGLYHDEAVAMVNTWSRQWFRTPGLRVLYLVPQEITEEQIPLKITPTPDSTVRVMMIRTEVITPELEAADVAAVGSFQFDSPDDAGQAHFMALGRFAEPRLRRALSLAPDSAGKALAEGFLATLASIDARSVAGE